MPRPQALCASVAGGSPSSGDARLLSGRLCQTPSATHRRLSQAPLLWGSCQVSSALRSFFVVVEFKELLLSSPRTPAAASGAGSGGAEPPRTGLCFFFWSVSSSSSGSAFVSSGNLLSASAPTRDRRLHYDLFGSGRGTSTLNLQTELSSRVLRGGCEGAPFQRVGLPGLRKFFCGKFLLSRAFFS